MLRFGASIVVFYNVSQLLREPVGASRSYRVDDPFELPYEGNPVVQVAGPVLLTRTPDGILAQAHLEASVIEVCSRCLQPALVPLHLRVEEQFLPTIDPVTGGRLAEPDEETPFRIDEAHHLDLSEAVRQAAVLEEPMAPLCRPDCRGLCPQCGADLNVAPCHCEPGPVDARWAALQSVLSDER